MDAAIAKILLLKRIKNELESQKVIIKRPVTEDEIIAAALELFLKHLTAEA